MGELMEEFMKKLKEAGKLEEAVKSEESLKAAAKKLGYTDEEIVRIISKIDLPLDDSLLNTAAGRKWSASSSLKRYNDISEYKPES